MAGISPYAGTWTKNHVQHLLKRTLVGYKSDHLNPFNGLTMAQCVTKVLTPLASELSPSAPVNDYQNSDAPASNDATVTYGQPWLNVYDNDNFTVRYLRGISLHNWQLKQCINQPETILQKMILFWLNHIPVGLNEVDDASHFYNYMNIFRQNAVGNFKTIIKEIAIAPSMLRYLNGANNTNIAPDENFARELMELFTIGKSDNANYTEEDVRQAAKVLTGYRITNYTSFFSTGLHDTSTKTFSAFFNNTVINGQTTVAGMEQELDALLTMIFSNDEVAKFICRKIYRYFVYYKIDAAVENDVITPLATIFRSNNYQITPVLEALFKSEHFYDNLVDSAVIKPPIDFLVGYCKEMKLTFPTDIGTDFKITGLFSYISDNLQQDIFNPPNVSGFPAYYQAPQFHEIWINTFTYKTRVDFSKWILWGGYTQDDFTLKVNLLDWVLQFNNINNPNLLIDQIANYFYALPVSTEFKLSLKDNLLSGQQQDYYWSVAWDNYMTNPTDMTNQNNVLYKLGGLLSQIFSQPEYQLS